MDRPKNKRANTARTPVRRAKRPDLLWRLMFPLLIPAEYRLWMRCGKSMAAIRKALGMSRE